MKEMDASTETIVLLPRYVFLGGRVSIETETIRTRRFFFHLWPFSLSDFLAAASGTRRRRRRSALGF